MVGFGTNLFLVLNKLSYYTYLCLFDWEDSTGSSFNTVRHKKAWGRKNHLEVLSWTSLLLNVYLELHNDAFIFVTTTNIAINFTEQLVLLHSEHAQGSWEDGNYDIIDTLKYLFSSA